MTKAYGVRFIRDAPGAYTAYDERQECVGGVYRDEAGVWHAQAWQGSGVYPPYKAERFDTLRWARRFVESNARSAP
jgi:hypothetical protein